MSLLEDSGDFKKLTTFKWLCREGGELIKQSATLDTKWDELEKKKTQLNEQLSLINKMERTIEEERRYREMLSSIRGIGSSLDNLRFGLDQWKTQQFLMQR